MLVLASSSRYRQELLSRLRLPFRIEIPDIDESALEHETPLAMATRLATGKALAVADRLRANPGNSEDKLIIGSDQVASIDGTTPIGKPGTHERASAQLRAAAGKCVEFHTAVSVVVAASRQVSRDVVTTRVRFRALSDLEIEAYLLAETPYDCAGAAKCEGLGISLLNAIEGPDPTAIIGLPLIALSRLLREAGCPPLPG